MTRIDRRWAAAGVAVLGALLLAGCAESEPAAAPSVTPSASESAAPSPAPSSVVVAPERTAAMDDDGSAGAEAAAKYFLELDGYIQSTGDVSIWESMSHTGCEYCTNRRDQARELAEADYVFTGGVTRVTILHTYEQDSTTGVWPIDVEVTVDATSVEDPTGEVVFSSEYEVSDRRIEVAKQDDMWVVVGVGLLDAD